MLCAARALGQAPESAGLWRIATGSLAVPPAVQTGPLAPTWNPAAGFESRGLAGGLQIVHTSNVVGISGFVAGLTTSVARRAGLGLVLGRLDVRDLVRTTTSPNTITGSIPVYTQYAGVGGQFSWHSVSAGALLRVNNERFDVIRETGATLDLGVSWLPIPRLKIAAATHLLPIDFSKQETTDYYLGLDYLAVQSARIGTVGASVAIRYGLTYRSYDAFEHSLSTGVFLGSYFGLNAALTREVAYGSHEWRPALALFLRIGSYALDFARSSGLNDLGATYRVGLSITTQ
jgi:hypothetical protein